MIINMLIRLAANNFRCMPPPLEANFSKFLVQRIAMKIEDENEKYLELEHLSIPLLVTAELGNDILIEAINQDISYTFN